MKLSIGFLVAAIALFAGGMVGMSEEAIVSSLVAAGASLATYVAERKNRRAGGADEPIAGRLAELERRLQLTEGDLESATAELDRIRKERDFDRQLLEARARTLPG